VKRLATSIAFASIALSACYNATPKPEPVAEEGPRRGKSYAAEKAELLYRMDREMNAVIAKYTKQLDDIRIELETHLASLAPPSQLLSVERAFRGFGAAESERYVAQIDAYVADAVAKTEALVGREKSVGKEPMQGAIEAEALRIAATIGGDGRGAGYGFVSGVEEVDERAHVTVEMLRGIGDVPGLRDLGELRKAEAVELSQLFRHEVTEAELADHAPQLAANVKPVTEGMLSRVGRFVLYQSEALEGFRMKDADATAVVIAFQGERLPDGRSWEFVQGVRNRVIRSGVIVRDFGWRLDPTTRSPNGRIPFGGSRVDTSFLATETIYPSINLDHSSFGDTRDFTLVNDYTTGLVDTASGEWLGAVRWQVRWIVSLPGEVRLVPGVEPSFDSVAQVLRELIHGGAPQGDGVREAAPSDLLAQRVEAIAEAEQPRARDLGDGVLGMIAQSHGRDRRVITAAGRKFLGARRIDLVTRQGRFREGLRRQPAALRTLDHVAAEGLAAARPRLPRQRRHPGAERRRDPRLRRAVGCARRARERDALRHRLDPRRRAASVLVRRRGACRRTPAPSRSRMRTTRPSCARSSIACSPATRPRFPTRAVDRDGRAVSEARFDPIRHEWVVIARDRERRPSHFRTVAEQPKPGERCPFCVGNEQDTTTEVLAAREPGSPANGPAWRWRVVTNLFPIVQPRPSATPSVPPPTPERCAAAHGMHEVVVETPDHGAHPADYSIPHLAELIGAFRQRARARRRRVAFRT
jgi:hypothetical protein